MKRKHILFVIKILIFIITIVYLYYEILLHENFKSFLQNFQVFDKQLLLGFVIVLFGMLINWGLESLKWQYLLRKIHLIGFFTSFKAVISGLTISIWMPNRMGEYLGRILYVPIDKSIKVILSTIIGSISQLITTIIFGSAALILYLIIQDFDIYMIWLLSSLILFTSLFSVFLYFNIYLINTIIPDINKKFAIKVKKYINVFSYYKKNELLYILILSVIRYLVFSTQFYLLLIIYDLQISVYLGYMLISIVFLVQSLIPTIALTEIGIRGAVSVYFLGQYAGTSQIGILMSAYSLWLINIVLPALCGAFFIILIKSRKT